MQKIIPFLWFNDNAEEAVRFYTGLIKDSKIGAVTRYDEEGAKASGRPQGSAMTVTFTLAGQQFMALNGGPVFSFSPAVSFMVKCKTQREIDELWEKLSEGGEQQQCGWLKDKYGLSWQIVPAVLEKMQNDPDPRKSQNMMKALMQMKKLDIAALEKAFTPQ